MQEEYDFLKQMKIKELYPFIRENQKMCQSCGLSKRLVNFFVYKTRSLNNNCKTCIKKEEKIKVQAMVLDALRKY